MGVEGSSSGSRVVQVGEMHHPPSFLDSDVHGLCASGLLTVPLTGACTGTQMGGSCSLLVHPLTLSWPSLMRGVLEQVSGRRQCRLQE
jgi:hypothetical protein